MMNKTRLVIALGVVCCLFQAGAVWAQAPSQGTVQRDRTIIWRTDVRVVAAIVRAGTVLDITAQSERWYEVIIPEALGGRGNRGLIARPQVVLLPGAPEPPFRPLPGGAAGASTAQSPQGPGQRAAAVRRAALFPRGFLSFNGAYQSGVNDFRETVTFHDNAEDGSFDTDYTIGAAPVVGVAVGGMVAPTVGIGVAVNRLSRSTPATMDVAIPHPFFFNAPRMTGAAVAGLRREEWAVHGQVRGVFALGSRAEISAIGGPSLFRIQQGIVTDFTYVDDYPYDSATFRTAESSTVRTFAVGFNAGGDVALYFTRRVGIGFTAMYSRAEADLPVTEVRTVRIRAGGVTTGAGLRIRF
jgi:hypothetical protein